MKLACRDAPSRPAAPCYRNQCKNLQAGWHIYGATHLGNLLIQDNKELSSRRKPGPISASGEKALERLSSVGDLIKIQGLWAPAFAGVTMQGVTASWLRAATRLEVDRMCERGR
jgi:hypothetical protein